MSELEYYTRRLQCSEEEKRECLETVAALSRLLYTARKEGLLALEPWMEGADPFFRDCLSDLIYGYEGSELRRLYKRLLAAGDYSGKDFLQNVLVTEGMLAAREGIAAGDFSRELSHWFGPGWQETVENTVREEWERMAPPREPRQTSVCPEFDRLLGLPPERRDELVDALWDVVQTPKRELVLSLKAAGTPVTAHLLAGMDPERRRQLQLALNDSTIVRPQDIAAAQLALVKMAFGETREDEPAETAAQFQSL